MSFANNITFSCNECGKEYLVSDDMEMPPNWFGVQIAIANNDGLIPPHERDIFNHFCSQECLIEHVSSKDLKERYYMADRKLDDDDQEEEEDRIPE